MRLSLLLKVAISYCILICMPAFSQDKESRLDKVVNFYSNFSSSVNKKTGNLEEQPTKQTERYLQHLAKREKSYNENFPKLTVPAPGKCLPPACNNINNLRAKTRVKQKSSAKHCAVNIYLGRTPSKLPSFLQQNNQLLANAKRHPVKIRGSLANVNKLQSKLQRIKQEKAFIDQKLINIYIYEICISLSGHPIEYHCRQ